MELNKEPVQSGSKTWQVSWWAGKPLSNSRAKVKSKYKFTIYSAEVLKSGTWLTPLPLGWYSVMPCVRDVLGRNRAQGSIRVCFRVCNKLNSVTGEVFRSIEEWRGSVKKGEWRYVRTVHKIY